MTDHFAVFSEPRRPWLDAERLKAKFQAFAAGYHPDVAGPESTADFSALNLAYQTLRDPRMRLRHLLELEAPEAISRNVSPPPAVGDLFAGIATKKQALGDFLKKRATAESALTKAMLMADQLHLQEELEGAISAMEAEKARWLNRIPALDEAWRESPSEPSRVIGKLAETAQALGYLDKWIAQIREGLVKLQIG